MYVLLAVIGILVIAAIATINNDLQLLNKRRFRFWRRLLPVSLFIDYSWPAVGGHKGGGGPFLSRKLGFAFPGEAFTPNITPFGLGNWTDPELYRLLTTGIDKTMDENEWDHIIAVLKKCNGRIWGRGAAAEVLNMPPTTLKSRMIKLGIKKEYTK